MIYIMTIKLQIRIFIGDGMIKFKFVFLALMLPLVFSSPTWAACNEYSCTGELITRLVVTKDGDISIGTSGDESALDCDAGSSNYIKLRHGVNNFIHIYSLLLTAQTTNRPLWIRTNKSGQCEVVYVVSDL